MQRMNHIRFEHRIESKIIKLLDVMIRYFEKKLDEDE